MPEPAMAQYRRLLAGEIEIRLGSYRGIRTAVSGLHASNTHRYSDRIINLDAALFAEAVSKAPVWDSEVNLGEAVCR